MLNIIKVSFVTLIIFSLSACVNGGVFFASKAYLAKSCKTLNREHTQLGRDVRGLMVKTLRDRKSYATARRVARSYTNWPVYFIIDGNFEFNQQMGKYKNQYQNIRFAALQNKCTFFRDVLGSDAYKTADSKY